MSKICRACAVDAESDFGGMNFSKLDYTDYKIAISKLYQGFTYGLAYTTTNGTDNNLYHVKANGDDKVLSGNILAASVSRSF